VRANSHDANAGATTTGTSNRLLRAAWMITQGYIPGGGGCRYRIETSSFGRLLSSVSASAVARSPVVLSGSGSGSRICSYGTVALSDWPTRTGPICLPRSHAAGLGCPVCHSSPRGLWSLLCCFGLWRGHPSPQCNSAVSTTRHAWLGSPRAVTTRPASAASGSRRATSQTFATYGHLPDPRQTVRRRAGFPDAASATR
jgi:hypothetical protein